MAGMPMFAASSAADRAAAIAAMCKKPHRTEKGGWGACCPAHDDHNPSLSIDVGRYEDRVLLHCHKAEGCPPAAICAALGLTMADLFCVEKKGKLPITAIYDYADENGTLLFQVCRMEEDGKKTFPQRRLHPTTPGAWIWDLKGVRRILYRLPEVREALAEGKAIYIAEGEKDVNALWALGVPATCNPMGAEKWKEDSYDQTLAGATCYLLPDHDATGTRHVNLVAKRLALVDATVKIVPGIHTEAEKSDVSDWLQAGGTREQLVAAAEAAPVWTPGGVMFQVTGTNGTASTSTEEPKWGWSDEIARHAADNDREDATPRFDEPPPGWRDRLFKSERKKNPDTLATSYNMTQILRYADFWREPDNALWFDGLTGRHMWGEEQIVQSSLVKASEWFGLSERMPISKGGLSLLEDCMFARCEMKPRDRIALWLNGLPPWDGIPRLDSWLVKIANAADDDFTTHLSRRLLLSMVARALRPGCQYREVIVFGGPENIGKSHIVEVLASKEFFLPLSMNLEAKEAHMLLRKVWLAELADLDSMNRTEDARMKAFITMEEDTYIPKYRNDSVTVPRRAIFVGTTNDRTYLKSLSGNTRFLPLWLPGPVKLDVLHAMRDQLFAEARHAYEQAGEGWWHMPHEIQEEARLRREKARLKSEYEGPLAEWLETTADASRTCWQDIAKYFLLIESPERWKDRSLQLQITNTLRALGYTPGEFRHKGTGKKVHGWIKETAPEEEEEEWNF